MSISLDDWLWTDPVCIYLRKHSIRLWRLLCDMERIRQRWGDARSELWPPGVWAANLDMGERRLQHDVARLRELGILHPDRIAVIALTQSVSGEAPLAALQPRPAPRRRYPSDERRRAHRRTESDSAGAPPSADSDSALGSSPLEAAVANASVHSKADSASSTPCRPGGPAAPERAQAAAPDVGETRERARKLAQLAGDLKHISSAQPASDLIRKSSAQLAEGSDQGSSVRLAGERNRTAAPHLDGPPTSEVSSPPASPRDAAAAVPPEPAAHHGVEAVGGENTLAALARVALRGTRDDSPLRADSSGQYPRRRFPWRWEIDELIERGYEPEEVLDAVRRVLAREKFRGAQVWVDYIAKVMGPPRGAPRPGSVPFANRDRRATVDAAAAVTAVRPPMECTVGENAPDSSQPPLPAPRPEPITPGWRPSIEPWSCPPPPEVWSALRKRLEPNHPEREKRSG